MKTYKEMADSVFLRIEEYEAAKKRRKRMLKRIGVTACCLALVFAVGAAAMLERNEMPASGGGYTGALPHDEGAADGEWWPNGEEADGNDPFENSQSEASAAESSQSAQLPFIGAGESMPDIDFKTVIDSYPAERTSCYRYQTPANGTFFNSIPLNAAIGEYGDGAVAYRVVLAIFRDGEAVSDPAAQKEEFARLCGLGYEAFFETHKNGEETQYWLGMTASSHDLASFTPNGEYGYIFFLYNERTQ